VAPSLFPVRHSPSPVHDMFALPSII
jgi:hypothetical protein